MSIQYKIGDVPVYLENSKAAQQILEIFEEHKRCPLLISQPPLSVPGRALLRRARTGPHLNGAENRTLTSATSIINKRRINVRRNY
jgi:hypothetical protein